MIGIFDSGVGGLSVLRTIREVAPTADVVYFGDTKNAPYGQKTPQELSRLTAQAMQLLQGRGVTHIVSACNSVSASLVVSLFDALAFDPHNLIEMVGPTATHFKTSAERIALCATPATIQSGIYQNAFAFFGKEVDCIAIPDLAGAVEAGEDDAVIESMVRDACGDLGDADTLILACTHYPLVQHVFERVIDGRVKIYDPALGVAKRAKELFAPQMEGKGTTTFLVSKETVQFTTLAEKVCSGSTYTIELV